MTDFNEGYKQGYWEGYSQGYSEGTSTAEERGFRAGYDEGFEHAYRAMIPAVENNHELRTPSVGHGRTHQNGFLTLSFRSVVRLSGLEMQTAKFAICEAFRCYGGKMVSLVSDEMILSIAHHSDPMDRAWKVAETVDPTKKKAIAESLWNAYQAILCNVRWWRIGHAIWGDIPDSARARYEPPARRGDTSALVPSGGSAGAPVGWGEVKEDPTEPGKRPGSKKAVRGQ